MIDQFLSSAEQKWNRMNGLVMLLPHGYEGQGPEHSSARMERFLQMCAEWNMVITNVTTAANLFHLLRRQLTWNFRKPLINFSPKANLRHPGSYSLQEEFTKGGFKEIIDDESVDAKKVKRILLCTGKVYFDLNDFRVANKNTDTAIVRLEQVYPLPTAQLEQLKKKYSNAEWMWVQEEPLNMGAASFMKMNFAIAPFNIVSRTASAATATGYSKVHGAEQEEIVKKAFSK
jgi:2-oxoglutarate dehydrogenase E1 component